MGDALLQGAQDKGFYVGPLHQLQQTQEAAQHFSNCINAAKASHPAAVGDCVYTYEVEEYQQMRLFVTPDGTAGVAVKDNGDMVSVFSASKKEAPEKQGRRVPSLLALAVNEGAIKGDCHGSFLTRLYGTFGFWLAARDAVNP